MRTLTAFLAAFAALIVVLFVAPPARAASCSWQVAPTNISFGAYNVFDPNDTPGNSTFTIRCNPNSYGRITITPVSIPWRTMTGPTTANYQLYLDGGRSQVWGDGLSGGSTYDRYNGTPQQKDFNDTIYGFAQNSQSLLPGTYTASVNVTLADSNSPTGPWSAVSPTAGYLVTVTMTVAPQCRVDTFALSFGQYDPFSTTVLTQTATVKVYCTPTTSVTSTVLDAGLYPSGTQRRMNSGTGTTINDYLNYNATLTGTTSGTSTSSLTPIANGFPLSGNIPAGQDVVTGDYKDSLQAVVNY